MIKKHADSDLNDIIIISSNIFSLPFPNLHRVYTENYAKLIIISSSQGKQKLRKEPVKKKKNQFQRVPSPSFHEDGIDAVQLLESRPISRKAARKI